MTYLERQKCYDPDKKILFKKQLFDLEQGFQSGPVPGTFTRLRSCIVPAEITELPKLAVVKTTSTMVEYFS
jgi:hypothetical protein